MMIGFVFVVMIICLPLTIGSAKIDNKLLKSAQNEQISSYIKFLNWMSFYETLNSKIH